MSIRRSLLWSYSAQGVSTVATFASTVAVARLVTPRDFGILAMAAAITNIIQVFVQLGLAKYIMRERELSIELLRSLFSVNLIMTIAYCIAILIGAFVSGPILHSNDVATFLVAFALFPLIAMMEFIPSSLAAREMKFGLISAIGVARALTQAGVTVVLAWKGYAYMSFVGALVISYALSIICFNVAIWRPDVWRLRFKGAREIVRFGFQMIGIGGITQLNTRAGEMTLGSLLGLSQLGLYNRASNLPATLHGNIFGVGTNVVFSRLSKDLRDGVELHVNYIRFMRVLLALLWPMMIGVAVLSGPMVALLYGAKWLSVALPLSLIMIATVITGAIGMTSEIFILRHRTQQQMRLEVVRAVFGYAAFAGGSLVSLTVAAFGRIAEAVFAFILYRKPMNEMIGGPEGALRRVYLEASALTIVAVIPAFILMMWYRWSPDTPLPLVAAAVASGILAWAILLIRIEHPLYLEVKRFVRR